MRLTWHARHPELDVILVCIRRFRETSNGQHCFLVISQPPECIESTEDVWNFLVALVARQFTLTTFHEFGGNLWAGAVLNERLQRLLQLAHFVFVERFIGKNS